MINRNLPDLYFWGILVIRKWFSWLCLLLLLFHYLKSHFIHYCIISGHTVIENNLCMCIKNKHWSINMGSTIMIELFTFHRSNIHAHLHSLKYLSAWRTFKHVMVYLLWINSSCFVYLIIIVTVVIVILVA